MKNTRYSWHHRRSYGLHFLKSERIARKIVEYADICDGDVVLEIGPGKGILTKIMLEKGAKVIGIEKSPHLYGYLKERFVDYIESDKFVLINDDALRVNFSSLGFNKVVSNLPYSISSQITIKLFKEKFKKGVLMYQKDFAERIANVPPREKFNRLAAMVYFLAEVRILFVVKAKYFQPPPKVDSAVVEVIPKNIDIPEGFETFLRILFSQPRKKLKNVLKNTLSFGNMRPEDLSPEDMLTLFNANKKCLGFYK